MHHEILLALLGFPGDTIDVRSDGYFIRKDLDIITDPQKTLLNRILTLGYLYQTLQKFVQLGKTKQSLYIRAIAHGIDMNLNKYANVIVTLEKKILSTNVIFPFPQFLYELDTYFELFPSLCHLIHKIQNINIKKEESNGYFTAEILSTLHRMTSSGFPQLRTCMEEILQSCHRVLYHQMLSWMLYGEVLDPYNEFFIKQKISTSSNKPRNAMSLFYLRLEAIPHSYFPAMIAEGVLFIGQGRHILAQQQASTINESQSIVQALEALANRPHFDAQVVHHSIETIRQAVANQLYDYVVLQSNFLSHFQYLKDFFLLHRGEIFQEFIEISFAQMQNEPSLKTTQELNHGVWREALSAFQLSRDEDMLKWFSLSLPKQRFSFKNFGSIDGLHLNGAKRDPSNQLISVDGPESEDRTCFVGWKCAQINPQAFAMNAKFRINSTASTISTSQHVCAFVLQATNEFNLPVLHNHEFSINDECLNRVFIEIQLARPSSNTTCTFVGRVRVKRPSEENRREDTYEDLALSSIEVQNTQHIHIHVAYSRVEKPIANSTDIQDNVGKSPIFDKILTIYLNGSVLLESVVDLSTVFMRKYSNANFEYFVGLAFTSSFHLSQWSLERYPTKTVRTASKYDLQEFTPLRPHDMWSFLQMEYHVKWPLVLLISLSSLQSYNEIFQFCLQLRRATHALERAWQVLRDYQPSNENNEIYIQRNACRIRSKMSFVFTNITTYVQLMVIEAQFIKCMEAINQAKDFNRVKRIYESFIANIVKQLYIHSKTIASALDDMILICWSFVHWALQIDKTTKSLNMQELHQFEMAFDAKFEFFYNVLRHSDARNLMFLLDYNGFYSKGTFTKSSYLDNYLEED